MTGWLGSYPLPSAPLTRAIADMQLHFPAPGPAELQHQGEDGGPWPSTEPQPLTSTSRRIRRAANHLDPPL